MMCEMLQKNVCEKSEIFSLVYSAIDHMEIAKYYLNKCDIEEAMRYIEGAMELLKEVERYE